MYESVEQENPYTREVDSIYTYFLLYFWKATSLNLTSGSEEFESLPASEQQAIKQDSRRIRVELFKILVVIVLVLMFQIVSLNALELNLYLITNVSDDTSLSNNISTMEQVAQANREKPPFIVGLSEMYLKSNGSLSIPQSMQEVSSYEFYELEVPGAYQFNNFYAVSQKLNFAPNFTNYRSNGILYYPFQTLYITCPITNYYTSSTSIVYYENENGEFLQQPYPMMVKDMYDLAALKDIDPTMHNVFLQEILKTDIYQGQYPTINTANQGEPLPSTNPQEIQYYVSIEGFEAVLSNYVMCWVSSNSIPTPDSIVTGEVQYILTYNGDAFIPNFSVCNWLCPDTTDAYIFEFNNITSIPTCNCYDDAEPIYSLDGDYVKIDNYYSCLILGKPIIDWNGYLRNTVTSYALKTENNNYFNPDPNRAKVQFSSVDVNARIRFGYPYLLSNDDSRSRSGLFIRPILLNWYRNCDAVNQVDLRGDLLAYPILADSYNQNKNVRKLNQDCLNVVDQDSFNVFYNLYYKYLPAINSVTNAAIPLDTLNSNCQQLCAAYDGFILTNSSDLTSMKLCVCVAEYDQAIEVPDGSGGVEKAYFKFEDLANFVEPCDNDTVTDLTIWIYQYINVNEEAYSVNYQAEGSDEVDTYNLQGFGEYFKVTAIRNKLLIMPYVDNNLNCVYEGDLAYVVFDTDNNRSIKTVSLNSSSPLQYTRVNGKTLYVCTPAPDTFDKTLTYYPQFEKIGELKDMAEKDLRYYFGDTLSEYQGCAEWYFDTSTFTVKQRYNGLPGDADEKAAASTYKLPRTLSYSSVPEYDDSLSFNYYSSYNFEEYSSIQIIQKQSFNTIRSFYNYENYYNVTTVFCFLLVLLCLFDESSEALFCIYMATRLWYLYLNVAVQKSSWHKTLLTGGWFMQMVFSIMRIALLTNRVLLLGIVMNLNVTIDALMMNSLALIFVLELDQIIYAWLFNNETYEFEAVGFSRDFRGKRIIFNVKYYCALIIFVYYQYVVGIYNYKNQQWGILGIIWKELNEMFNTGFNQNQLDLFLYCSSFICAFGFLLTEITHYLFNSIRNNSIIRKKENIEREIEEDDTDIISDTKIYTMLILLQIVALYLTSLFGFYLMDNAFYYQDYVKCLSFGNLNCNHNLQLESEASHHASAILVLTPLYFIPAYIGHYIKLALVGYMNKFSWMIEAEAKESVSVEDGSKSNCNEKNEKNENKLKKNEEYEQNYKSKNEIGNNIDDDIPIYDRKSFKIKRNSMVDENTVPQVVLQELTYTRFLMKCLSKNQIQEGYDKYLIAKQRLKKHMDINLLNIKEIGSNQNYVNEANNLNQSKNENEIVDYNNNIVAEMDLNVNVTYKENDTLNQINKEEVYKNKHRMNYENPSNDSGAKEKDKENELSYLQALEVWVETRGMENDNLVGRRYTQEARSSQRIPKELFCSIHEIEDSVYRQYCRLIDMDLDKAIESYIYRSTNYCKK